MAMQQTEILQTEIQQMWIQQIEILQTEIQQMWIQQIEIQQTRMGIGRPLPGWDGA